MADLKKYTLEEALEICRRMGLSETPLSNSEVLIGTNDKGHIYKFPLKTKADYEKEKAASKQPKVEKPVEEKPVELIEEKFEKQVAEGGFVEEKIAELGEIMLEQIVERELVEQAEN